MCDRGAEELSTLFFAARSMFVGDAHSTDVVGYEIPVGDQNAFRSRSDE